MIRQVLRGSTGFPLFIGVVDGLAFAPYILGLEIGSYYVIMISIKILLTIIDYRRFDVFIANNKYIVYFLVLLMTSSVIQLIAWGATEGFFRLFLFSISMTLSTFYFSTNYIKGLLMSGGSGQLLYIYQSIIGQIPSIYGRYMYFNDTHPNLAGEIAFATAFAALIYNRPLPSLLIVSCALYISIITQSRAAMLSIIYIYIIILAIMVRTPYLKYPNFKIILMTIMGIIGIITILIFPYDAAFKLLSDLLLVSDDFRGASTGASGRSDHWLQALRTFSLYPLSGGGLEFPERDGVLQPHNFALWAIAGFGIMGVAMIFYLSCIYIIRAYNSRKFAIFSLSFVPMLVFNDRFINLNIYPLIFFIYLFHNNKNLKNTLS